MRFSTQLLSLALATVSLAAPASALAETIKVTIGSGQPLVFPHTALLRDFVVPEIDKRLMSTPHRIQWTQAFAGTVAKIGTEVDAVQNGLLDISYIPFANNESKIPLYTFTYFLPFASTDGTASAAAFGKTMETVRGLGDTWGRLNQVYLATIAVEGQNLYSRRPIRTMADFKGLKVGVIGPNALWFRNTGAVGVTLNVAQITNDMQSGIFEAAVLADSVAAAVKVHEAGKHRQQFDFGAFVIGGVTMNRDKWNALPPQVRDVFTEVFREYQDRSVAEFKRRASDGLEAMGKAGLVSADVGTTRAEWAAAMPNLSLEWANQNRRIGPTEQIVETYMNNLRAAGMKPARNWSGVQ